MRPAGEIRQALLTAATELMTPERAPTVAEMACHAKVGMDAAHQTVKNMRRHGALRIVRTRRVDYRNRPVAEYAPPHLPEDGAGFVDLAMVCSAWAA